MDDMVESNRILYEKGEKPDHCVVIKYVPYVGDSKRAMDEYTSEIFMHGHNTIVLHNTCEVCGFRDGTTDQSVYTKQTVTLHLIKTMTIAIVET